ncbi:MAG TPA: hypothetical protein VEX11_11360 [Acetobacteraceae bacterium]|nr:hypothetical protein [Acetobacteraceae bacterium]
MSAAEALPVPRTSRRERLPKPTDRLSLGYSGLTVSPICIGIVGEPETVPAAFDAGVNFFFVSADLHWPLYQGVRRGLELLFERGNGFRDQVVVGVVSYLDQPLFQALQFHEVLQSVRGLERVDLLIAGAVSSAQSYNERLPSLQNARATAHCGARAIGCSFHDRRCALGSINLNALDISYIRYNTAHPGAESDIFPFMRRDRTGLIFNFKSVLSAVTPEHVQRLGLGSSSLWLPKITDYYRFVLTNPHIDGVLCSPSTPSQFAELQAALEDRPLTVAEERYMAWLSSAATPKYF